MIKKHAKTFIYSLALLALIGIVLFSYVSGYVIETKGIEFSEKNIDDKYGKLDTNTKLVLEKKLQSKMEEENVELYFSFVYEDLNENYIQHLSQKKEAIFIYYNDTTKTLNVLSNIALNKSDFKKVLTSKDDLSSSISNYLNSICSSIDEPSGLVYMHHKHLKSFATPISIFGTILFSIVFVYYFKYLRFYLKEIKKNKENKNVKVNEQNKTSTEVKNS